MNKGFLCAFMVLCFFILIPLVFVPLQEQWWKDRKEAEYERMMIKDVILCFDGVVDGDINGGPDINDPMVGLVGVVEWCVGELGDNILAKDALGRLNDYIAMTPDKLRRRLDEVELACLLRSQHDCSKRPLVTKYAVEFLGCLRGDECSKEYPNSANARFRKTLETLGRDKLLEFEGITGDVVNGFIHPELYKCEWCPS